MCPESFACVRLVYDKYQYAIAALIMAKSISGSDGTINTAPGWRLDIREHEFKDTGALHRALCLSSNVVSLNSLSLEDDQNSNLNYILQRDRCFD